MSSNSETTQARRPAWGAPIPGRSRRAYLTILSGESVGTIVALDKRRISIGRGENADLRFRDDTISRNHAQIQIDADGFAKVADIGSRNGIFVNGVPIRDEVLRDGDRLAFGGELVADVRYGNPTGLPGVSVSRSDLSAIHVSATPSPSFEHTADNYRAQLELRERAFGLHHPSRAVVLHALAAVQIYRGGWELAASLYATALQIQTSSPGVHPTEIAQSHFRLARCLMLQGLLCEAEASLAAGHDVLSVEARCRGEAFEYHLVAASIADLQTSSAGAGHLREAERLLAESTSVFAHAKRILFDETLELLSSEYAEAKQA